MSTSDPRPRPQYGEYATPEEVAALRGTPAPPAVPAPPAGQPPAAPAPGVAPGSGRPAVSGARRFDRPVTIALLAFGVINLVQYAAPLLDFANTLDVAMAQTPYGSIDFGEPARVGGLVILGVMSALVVGSTALAAALLRRGRIAFWVPLTAGVLVVVSWVIVLTVVVLQTPDPLLPAGT